MLEDHAEGRPGGNAERGQRQQEVARCPRNQLYLDREVAGVEARRFRSLKAVEQDVGPFRALVGPNGSGKTTFLDVIALLGEARAQLCRAAPFASLGVDAVACARTTQQDH